MSTIKLRSYAPLIAILGLVLALTQPQPTPASAATLTDITSQVLTSANVTLAGDSVINLPPGTTTYNGVLSGQGTLTVRAPSGPGTLILSKDSDFTLPAGRQRQHVTTTSGPHPFTTVTNPDPPAIIVAAGATLWYGNGGSTGVIGHYPYNTPGYQLNQDNIEVDGTLYLQIINRNYNLGTISGSGLLFQPRNNWGTLDLAGTHPFSGVIYNGTGMAFGKPYYPLSLPNAKAVVNTGSAIVTAMQNYTLVLRQNFYEDHWGDDINFHSAGNGVVVMTGVYSYADTGVPNNPSLSNPALNFAAVKGNANIRGINIEGAHVQWGDGTTSRFFLPGTPADYINVHKNGSLAFDYNGPVTLDTPISGGIYHASLSTPATASVTLNATPGNAVTFATPMNYHGTTTIGHGATLLLGSGQAGGDSTLLNGTAADRIADDGTLTVRNVKTPVALSAITGAGGLTQAGAATTTLKGTTSYTGATTVSAGTLALGAGASGIDASSGLALTGSGARFDISAAGDQIIKGLTGVAGSTLALGGHTLTVGTGASTSFAGTITGTSGALTKVGTGTLSLSGHAETPAGTWQLKQGTLAVAAGAGLDVGSFVQSAGSTLAVAPTQSAPLNVSGTARLAGTLTVTPNPATQRAEQITVIHSSQPIEGTFTGLPEGATLTAGGGAYQITYTGGAGHDVVLKVLRPATATSAQPTAHTSSDTSPPQSNATPNSSGTLGLTAAAGGAAAAAALGLLIVALWRRRRRTRP